MQTFRLAPSIDHRTPDEIAEIRNDLHNARRLVAGDILLCVTALAAVGALLAGMWTSDGRWYSTAAAAFFTGVIVVVIIRSPRRAPRPPVTPPARPRRKHDDTAEALS